MPSIDVAINAMKAQQGANQFDSAVKKIQGGAGDIDRSTAQNEKSFSGLGRQISTVATGLMGLAAVYKTVRFAQTAIKEAAAFEMELANVSTMLDDQTMRYLPGYEKQLSNLAIKYGQSTATLSKGLYDILSACINANDAMIVLEAGVKAGTAGLTSAAVATNALITIINSYGYSAKEAGKISDILFALVKRGVLTFEELSSTIGNVIAIAASANLPLEQVAAGIATMTRAGIKADMAMTSLKGIITTFLTPAEESIEVAKRFGLELNSTTLQTLGLTGVMEKLKYATIDETAAIFSNVRALLGVAATRKSVLALMQDYKAMMDSAGATETAFQKIAGTTEFQLGKNRELFKGIKRDIGEGIKPALDLWMAGFRPFVDEWKQGWQLMVKHMEESVELIRLRLIPTDANRDFVRQMLDADEAILKFKKSTEELSIGLDKIDKMKVEVAPIELGGPEKTKELTETEKKFIDEKKKAGLEIKKLFDELKFEKELIGLTTEERERAIKVVELEAQAKVLLGDKSGDLVKIYKKELEELQQMQGASDKAEKIMQQYFDSINNMDELSLREKIQNLERWGVAHKTEIELIEDGEKRLNEAIKALQELQKGGYTKYLEELQYNTDNWTTYANDKFGEVAQTMESSLSNAFVNMASAGGSWKDAMKGFFIDVLGSYQKMLADMAAKQMMQAVIAPAMNWIGAGISGAIGGLVGAGVTTENPMAVYGVPAGIYHRGGIVGETSVSTRKISAMDLYDAPRLHGGFNANEFPAVLNRNEVVFPDKASVPGKGNVVVNVINESGTPLSAEKRDSFMQGEKQIINIVLKNYHEGKEMYNLIGPK